MYFCGPAVRALADIPYGLHSGYTRGGISTAIFSISYKILIVFIFSASNQLATTNYFLAGHNANHCNGLLDRRPSARQSQPPQSASVKETVIAVAPLANHKMSTLSVTALRPYIAFRAYDPLPIPLVGHQFAARFRDAVIEIYGC